MANYLQLKAAIDQVIKANGQKEITGPVLNDTLKAIVNSLGAGYQFRGVATPSTNPGTPDQNVFYIAGQAGTYANFNSTVLPNGVSILKWNGSWSGETVVAGDGVFDISAYKATGGTLATFADLSAALDGGDNIPSALRKGGMSVKFIQGSAQSSDNKYVQYRYMGTATTGSPNPFLDTANWQGVDDTPTADSDNLVKSGGVYDRLHRKTNIKSINLIDLESITPNYIISSEGALVSSNDAFISDYIPVEETDIISNAWNSPYWSGGNVYNSNKEFIRTLGYTPQYEYQSGDAYVRFSFLKSNTTPMANFGTTLKDYVPFNPISGYIEKEDEIISKNSEDIKQLQAVSNLYFGVDNVSIINLYALAGGLRKNNEYKSFVFPVKEGDVIEIKGNANYTCCATCVEYPSARDYLTGETRYTVNSLQNINISSGVKYFVCGLNDSTNNVTPSSLKLNGYDIVTEVLKHIQELENEAKKSKMLQDALGFYTVLQSSNRALDIRDKNFIAEGNNIVIQIIDGVSGNLAIYNGSTQIATLTNGNTFFYTVPANTTNLYLYNSVDATFKVNVGVRGEIFDTNEVKELQDYIPLDKRYYVNLFCAWDGVQKNANAISVVYEINEGDVVTLKANNNGYQCWMFSDIYPEVGNYREGFARTLVAPGQTETATAPSGSNYLMINLKDSNGTDVTPLNFTINKYNQILSLRDNIGSMVQDIDELKTKTPYNVADGQLYAIGTIDSEKATTSNNGESADYYVGSKELNRKAKRDYFTRNIVAINHDDVSPEDLFAIRKIYNKYGFNGNFNIVLTPSRQPSQAPYIKALSEDGNDIGLHAFLGGSAWLINKMFDVKPDGTMTFYGDSFSTYKDYILYTMDGLIDGYTLDGTFISASSQNAKTALQWAEYYYNELVDNTLGYSTIGTVAEKFAADYTGTYPTKQQIVDGDFSGCGHFTKGLFKGCCSCCNYEAWDRILEVSIAYIRHFYGINNFTGCGPHGVGYAPLSYEHNGFYYDDAEYLFLQNGQCRVFSSRLGAWTSFFDTLKRFGIKNCGNYSAPDTIELEAREGMYFGQKNVRSDFFDRPGLRADYLTLMGTSVHSPYSYTQAEFEAIWGDVDNWLKYAYENAGVEVTKNGVTATICDYIKNAIDRINYCKDTGKIPTLSFDTIWNTPACSVAFELLCQYCYENDIELVPVEKARRIAVSFAREWQRNYYPNPSFTQTLLNKFGGSSTSVSAYLPDGMRLLSSYNASISVGTEDGHRVLQINGGATANVKMYGLPEGSYKFTVNAKGTANASIKVFKRKVGDFVDDDTNTLVANISLTNSYAQKEATIEIPAPYKVPVDVTAPVSIISEGYENNVCIIEIRYIVPAGESLTFYAPKIELI